MESEARVILMHRARECCETATNSSTSHPTWLDSSADFLHDCPGCFDFVLSLVSNKLYSRSSLSNACRKKIHIMELLASRVGKVTRARNRDLLVESQGHVQRRTELAY